MEDHVDAIDRLPDDRRVAQVPLEEVDLVAMPGEIPLEPGGEVVEHPHVFSLLHQALDDVRANEACPASDEVAGQLHRAFSGGGGSSHVARKAKVGGRSAG